MTVLDYQSPQVLPPRPTLWILETLAMLGYGILLPIACFIMAWGRCPLAVEWQSGQWFAEITHMLSFGNAWPFYPMLLFSMISLGRFLVRPVAAGGSYIVRLGLFTGVLTAFQFAFILSLAFFKPSPGNAAELAFTVLGPLGVFVVAIVAMFVIRLLWVVRRYLWYVVLAAFLLGVLLSFISREVPWAIFGIVVLGSLTGGPAIAAGVYAYALFFACWSTPREPYPLAGRIAWPLAWVAADIAAWKISLIAAAKTYATLPTTAPGGCFVVTAAASGHPRFVRSREILTSAGTSIRVNDQLRHLKFAELAVAIVSPRSHRAVRKIYDRLGPPIARRVTRHPLFADVTYAMLKLIEWPAMFVLTIFFPRWRRWAKCMMASSPPSV